MIIVRNDDVLNDTSSYKFKGKEFDRFRFIHKMIMETHEMLQHRPTILCTEIESYPEAIEYIRAEKYNMSPQLHGFEHKDYVHLPKDEIREMLDKSIEWFDKNLNTEFHIWATPWGGTNPDAIEVCEEYNIILQTTGNTYTPGQVLKAVRAGEYEDMHGFTILHHWWDRGLNLFRLCEVFKHGSYEAAKEADERGWF